MTEENRRHNIAVLLREAENALEEADLLLEHGRTKGAVSRAYYAALNGARALLLSEGLEPRSHAGVARLVYQQFVSSGRLDANTARTLRVLQVSREDADYEPAAVFTPDMARQDLRWLESISPPSGSC